MRRDLEVASRLTHSHYYTLLKLNMENPDNQGKKVFMNYTRFTAPAFLYLLAKVEPAITKSDTNWRPSLDPGLKLAATLRYLATGDSFHSVGYAFNVAHNTISKFVPEVCAALVESLKDEAFPPVASTDDWKAIAERFERKWDLPHCLGALDGKHIRINAPPFSGSLYHNYKKFFSIPMLALADADYRFLWVDLGGEGHMSDAQIWTHSDLYQALENDKAKRPPPCPLTTRPGDQENVPFFLVADEAFGLKDYCLKPFSRRSMDPREKVFNYRLSRARRVVESAFGILAMRFRLFTRPQQTRIENVIITTKAAVVLHNVLAKRLPLPPSAFDREDADGTQLDGEWRQVVRWKTGPAGAGARVGRAATPGVKTRLQMADFFGSPQGAVPWQWRMARVQDPGAPEQEPAAADQEPEPAAAEQEQEPATPDSTTDDE